MISQIDHLQDFGIYRNFQWNGLPAFSKRNLFYGWNYSGKTTLSRLFQILEKPDRIVSWSNASFRVTLADGSSITPANLIQPPKIRVFNRDFVLTNFSQEHTAPAVFILGAQNVALRQRLEMLKRRCERVVQIETDLQGQANGAQSLIDQLGTNKARDIGNLLGDRTFRRPNIMRRVEEVRATYTTFILSDADVTAKFETCRSTSAWAHISPVAVTLPDISARSSTVAAKLAQTASNRALERLKANHNLESWVRSGLELHRNSVTCEFCGSTITDARLAELKGHFSQEYESLVRELATTVQEYQTFSLETALPDERDFVPDLKAEFNGLKTNFENWVVWAEELRAKMINALTQKQTRIESMIAWEADLNRATEGVILIGQVNNLIQRHNLTVAALAQTRTDAKTALERHYAALLFRDDDLSGKETSLAEIRNRVAEAGVIRGRVNSQITAVELQVRQQSIGAAKLNDVLRFLLSGNNIEVAVVGDGLFEFRRDAAPASNLSDGEKTAIAFAYFLTSLEANGAVLADTIVFIDDPISSLDSNHIYAVYALLVERLKDCRQLFISTHSSELFNLMKDRWFIARDQYCDNNNACAYYVRRSLDANTRWTANLESLPILLRKYKSEYQFVFEQLHSFSTSPNPSLHEAYTSPNLLRKFLEAYLGFKKPCISQWSAKLDLIFDTPEEQREIQKFADDASHLQILSRSLQHPEFVANAQLAVRKVINGLKVKDFDHYKSLCTVIGVAP